MIGLPAALVLGGCIRPAKALDGNWGQFAGAAGGTVGHSMWDAFLARYVTTGADNITRVAYAAAARSNAGQLRVYLTALQAVDPTTLRSGEPMAFWINLYNAATVDLIVQNPDIASIRDLGPLTTGPWRDKIVTINGVRLSLDDIEHGILRPLWKDVRIHYAVNCASIGCPNLATKAFTAERLEVMLEQAAVDFINHPRGFSSVDGKLNASSIYDWYGSDWGSVANILAHARRYARGATVALLSGATDIDGYHYDWALNKVER